MCEDLQLLDLISKEDRYSTLPARRPEELLEGQAFGRTELRNLLVISYCLAGSGSASDAVSVGLERSNRGMKAVLALDRPVRSADKEAATRLFDVLARAAKGVEPFPLAAVQAVAAEVSRPSIERLFRKALNLIDDAEFESALVQYGDQVATEVELGASHQLCQDRFGDIGVVGTVRALVGSVRDSAVSWLTDSALSEDESSKELQRVFVFTNAIGNTLFLRTVAKERAWDHPLRRLKRTAGKISLFCTGLMDLITDYRRLLAGKGEDIGHRWLSDPTLVTVNLSATPWDALRGRNCDNHSKLARRLPELASSHRRMSSGWQPRIEAHVHAEVRLVLDLEACSPSRGDKVYVGRSKRSCYTCTTWLHAYNVTKGQRWRVWRGHGPDDCTWLTPPQQPRAERYTLSEINSRLLKGEMQMGSGAGSIAAYAADEEKSST